ncbi:MAG TPA: sialidase family protein, partial [Bryobacteraceae bacterium]|nr:sialidase family protein [Bryobacteraceae bacterium]
MSCKVFLGLFLCALTFAQNPSDVNTAEKETEDNALRRMEHFYGPRRYPDATFQPGGRLRAFREMQRMDQAVRSGKTGLRGAGLQDAWKAIGPKPINFSAGFITSGRVTAIAVDPRNNDVIYIGGADGGIWKTTDGGTTWTPLTDQEASLSTGAIALDPSNPDIVYVGTGEQNFAVDNYNGAGILKSVDGGQTWINIPGPFANSRIGALAVKPDDGKIILAASILGLHRSTDAGLTWTIVNPGTAVAVFFDPQQPNVAWSANGNIRGSTANGVYRSTDGGATWTIVRGTGTNTIPSGTSAGRIEVVPLLTSPKSALAAVAVPLGTAATLIDIY